MTRYRKNPCKLTGCNVKINSPAADRTDAFTRAGGAKFNTLNSVRGDERGCVCVYTGGANVQNKEFLLLFLDKCHRGHNEDRFVQVLAAASLRYE